MSTLWMLSQVISFVLSSSFARLICFSEISGRFSVNLLKTVSLAEDKYSTPLNCRRRMLWISLKPSSVLSICSFYSVIGIFPNSSTKDPFLLDRFW